MLKFFWCSTSETVLSIGQCGDEYLSAAADYAWTVLYSCKCGNNSHNYQETWF